MKYIIYLISLCFLFSCSDSYRDEKIQKAINDYKQGNYQQSVDNFKKILQNNHTNNGYLYYNLANAYYRLGKYPDALQNYRNAHKFLPRDADLNFNMNEVIKLKIDIIEEKIDYVQMFFSWINYFTNTEYFILGLCLLFISLIYWYIKIFKYKFLKFYPILIIKLFALLFIIISFLNNITFNTNIIVKSPEINLKSGDSDNNLSLLKLHALTEAKIIDMRGDWVQILLLDNKKGWLKKSDVLLY